jgi:uncharacterized membrane protein YeaQ/YmgE (transglycosylase-associated protein family)
MPWPAKTWEGIMGAWDIILWIVFGLVAGILAKWFMPGHAPGGFILTVLLGIAGAVVGGWIAGQFIPGLEANLLGRLVVAVGGAVLLLFVYGLVMKGAKK